MYSLQATPHDRVVTFTDKATYEYLLALSQQPAAGNATEHLHKITIESLPNGGFYGRAIFRSVRYAPGYVPTMTA